MNVLQCDDFIAIILKVCDVVIIYDRFLGEREAFDHCILDYMETELLLKYINCMLMLTEANRKTQIDFSSAESGFQC